MPAYASVAIIIFTQVWNEFVLALTLATPTTATVQVKLAEIKGSFVAFYNVQMAAALITIFVPMVFFLLLGRYFIPSRVEYLAACRVFGFCCTSDTARLAAP